MTARKKVDVTPSSTGLPADYPASLESLKSHVRQAQMKVMLSVDRVLIQLYWNIGREIVQRQEHEGWGKKVVNRLAKDIQRAFPGLQSFSSLNIWRI